VRNRRNLKSKTLPLITLIMNCLIVHLRESAAGCWFCLG
jgi:hypothetical protein